ncbi:MAG: hypothetical protein WAN20_23195 [Pseudonocardiaceae bacterium]|jgi:hypothetical protein|nr:hypothetical protein [Pseudonocardiaceae bacterium]
MRNRSWFLVAGARLATLSLGAAQRSIIVLAQRATLYGDLRVVIAALLRGDPFEADC